MAVSLFRVLLPSFFFSFFLLDKIFSSFFLFQPKKEKPKEKFINFFSFYLNLGYFLFSLFFKKSIEFGSFL